MGKQQISDHHITRKLHLYFMLRFLHCGVLKEGNNQEAKYPLLMLEN